jgi:hypothetical protein
MEKQDVNSILLANFYFLKCRFENPSCPKTELARRFLIKKVRKALTKKILSSDNLSDQSNIELDRRSLD